MVTCQAGGRETAICELSEDLEEQRTQYSPQMQVNRALVLSVVLYSSESWTMNKSTQRKLESFHTSCLRRILCLSYIERVTTEEVLTRSRWSTLSATIMIKRLKWFGHVLRMNDDRLALRDFRGSTQDVAGST